MPFAASIEPSPRSVLTVTSRNPVAASGATTSRTVMRVGDVTSAEATDTPPPATATVLPARKPVPAPVSSTSSAAPCGTAAGSSAATTGRTAEIPRFASVLGVALERVGAARFTPGWKLNSPPVNRLSSANVRIEVSTPSASAGLVSSGFAPAVSSAPRAAAARACAGGFCSGGQLPESMTCSSAPFDA